MTTKETLHLLVDQLPEDQNDLARVWLEDLRDASDVDGPPLDPATLAELDLAIAEAAEGKLKPLEQYEHERGL